MIAPVCRRNLDPPRRVQSSVRTGQWARAGTQSSFRLGWATAWLVLSVAWPAAELSAGQPSARDPQAKELFVIPEAAGIITFRNDFRQVVGAVPGKIWRATEVAVWDVATRKLLFTLSGHRGGIWRLDYDPSGSKLVTNDNYAVRLWDLSEKKQLLTIDLPSFTRSVAFTHKGKRLATGHDDGHVRLWDAETGRSLGMLKGHADWVPCLAYLPDKNWLASGSIDETMRLWDLDRGEQIQIFRGHEWYLSCVAWGPEGKRLASGSDDRTARIWDVETGEPLRVLRGHRDWIRAVAFSPNGRWVATASSDHTVKLWNATSGAEVLTIDRDTSEVNCVVFSPDGQRLATACRDRVIRFWDISSLHAVK